MWPKMDYLFDSNGRHIANLVNDQLHHTHGKNIGHFLRTQNIFIDMRGRYLGELVMGNRLMRNQNSIHKSSNYGVYGNYGNVGNYGNLGNHGSIGNVAGFDDIPDGMLH